MALDTIIRGVSSGTGAEVDANNNAKVNLPTTIAQAGFVQTAYVQGGAGRAARITEEGELYGSTSRLLCSIGFNNAAGTMLTGQFDQTATTMTLAASSGFLRFNSGLVTTASIGAAIRTYRTFTVEDGAALRGKFHIRHTNGSVANKQCDVGFGYAGPAAGQGAAMNEFVGFRWTTAGALLGVVEYSTGGAPTSLTVNINGGVPYSDNVSREYEVIFTDNAAEFWIDNVYQAKLSMAADSPGILKGCAYPAYMRLFHTGSAPASAPAFDLGDIAVLKVGFEADVPVSFRQALQGRHIIHNQTGLTSTQGSPFVTAASGTGPTAATGSNTATVFTGMGGFFRANGASIVTTVHSNVIVSSFQNPSVPTAAGAGNDVRNMVITDIIVNPMVVSAALTTQTGAVCVNWFVAIGSTALSLATADGAGTTAPGTKAPRIFPLPMNDSHAATPAVGTVLTRVGSNQITLGTPLVVHPGEWVVVGFRSLVAPSAAATAGTYDGSLALSGYWD